MEKLFYKNFTFKVSDKIRGYIVQGLRDLNLVTLQSISNFFSSLAKFLFALALSPFVLFYLLKDDTKIARGIEHLFPSRHQPQVRQFLVEVDHMLNHFIEGRFIIAFICSVLLLIGFLIIGIDMPVILSLVSLLFYIIPTFGCFLAMILPIFVGFSMNVSIGIETTILVASVAAVEGLYISNLVMGKTLFIHPLTVILILLIGGAMGGIIGLLFAIPAYLFLKLLFIYLYRNIQATQP
jgi:predicted PurR-regulated permease PerM